MIWQRAAAVVPGLFPLQPPRLDGSTWVDRRRAGRPTFEVSALYEMGQREAVEAAAHEIAEKLLDELLPVIPLGAVTAADEPYVHRILRVATQLGVGIGLVEIRSLETSLGSVDRRIWAVLWLAVRDLPEIPTAQRFAAAYLMQAGHFIARAGSDHISAVAETLMSDLRTTAR